MPTTKLPPFDASDAFLGAADVATHCLNLSEWRDGRRPGKGSACAPRGGWDGDFREDASPWDAHDAGPSNRGPGR